MNKKIEKICCSYQNAILEAILKQQVLTPEYMELFGTWMGIGRKSDGSVNFNCFDCDLFYSTLKSKIDKALEAKSLSEFVAEVGCCRSIGIIYDLDGQPNLDKFTAWLVYFKDIMCQSCNDKAYQFTLKTGLINTIVKEMRKYE